jgi:hypothetical protein
MKGLEAELVSTYTHIMADNLCRAMCVCVLSSQLRSLGHFPASQILNSLYSTPNFYIPNRQRFQCPVLPVWSHTPRKKGNEIPITTSKNLPCVCVKRAFCYFNGETGGRFLSQYTSTEIVKNPRPILTHKIFHELSNFVEQGQEMIFLHRNPMVHYSVHKSPSLDPILK